MTNFRFVDSGLLSKLCPLQNICCNDAGGATHHFVYPLFFSFIDLEQIQNIGWLLWPIFKLNGGRYTFCSLDEKDHLQDWVKEQSDIQNKNNTSSDLKNTRSTSLLQRAYSFIEHRTKGARKLSEGGSIRLMAHLTYFGYCFNPISVFYCLRPEMRTGPQAIREKSDCCHEQNATANDTSSISATLSGISAADLLRSAAAAVDAAPISTGESKSSIESIIVEVSNTPWIEQHSYMLDESIPNVGIIDLS